MMNQQGEKEEMLPFESLFIQNSFLLTLKLQERAKLVEKMAERMPNRLLTQRYFAPYLLLHLIDRDSFMKRTEFEAFNACLDNSSQFELEELSKVAEYEERFMRFLRYIEILEANDVRKVEGTKLIERIFNLEKF